MSGNINSQTGEEMSNGHSPFTILVTGGAGYIGSHTVLLLLQHRFRVVVIDNCVTGEDLDANGNICSLPESLRRVQKLTHTNLDAFYNLDLVNDFDNGKIDKIFSKHSINAVVHFAAFKAVSESIRLPLEYYTNNLIGTLNLLNCMRRNNCYDLIFSSSATVYGQPQYLPIDELHQIGCNVLNPYGWTKCMIEQILKDLSITKSNLKSKNWNIISLRYFNPVGAHPSGLIGEHCLGIPNNLMPYITQVAVKKLDAIHIFGNDYDTSDGTGVRDYIHIMDLANGHICALNSLFQSRLAGHLDESSRLKSYNLGTGQGYSVLEIIKAYIDINKVEIPIKIAPRREGDAGAVFADVSLAKKELNFTAKLGLNEMVRDAHRWQVNCPDGYKTEISDKSLFD